MAANRKKQKTPVAVFQKDPGPWSPLLINWLFTLGVILVHRNKSALPEKKEEDAA